MWQFETIWRGSNDYILSYTFKNWTKTAIDVRWWLQEHNKHRCKPFSVILAAIFASNRRPVLSRSHWADAKTTPSCTTWDELYVTIWLLSEATHRVAIGLEMDIRDLSFPASTFDVAIDKGGSYRLLSCILSNVLIYQKGRWMQWWQLKVTFGWAL
jgi:hypothetical protein